MRAPLILSIFLLPTLAGVVSAQEGHYRVDGVGPEGVYRGSAQVEIEQGRGGFTVSMRAFDGRARELRYAGTTQRSGNALRGSVRGTREDTPLPILRLHVERVEKGALAATYFDGKRRVIRRESWTRATSIEVPLVVIALESSGKGPFQGVPRDEAVIAQRRVEAQLNTTFREVGIHFRTLRDRPYKVPGERFDKDGDGRLSKEELALLQSALEQRGYKQPGRVVLVLTDAPFAHPGCRGWTPGDAPPTPHTLTDPNDNLSIVGRAYLSPARFHTVAHEVGHQLGLDDLYKTNRGRLEEPQRPDHLMESGGRGFHLDPAVLRILRRHVAGFPNCGLEGRLDREPVGGHRDPAAK